MSAQPAPIEVFSSYADADKDLCIELDKHLSQLERDGLITAFHKHQIVAGTDWMKTIDRHLNTASIILLLVSSDFLASEYCYGVEVQRAMERHQAGEAHVIPILLRAVDWQSAPFGELQALPSSGVPVTQWSDQDAAFADIARGIRTVLQDLQRAMTGTPRTSFPRIWNIPFPRNPVFTGREDILSRIHTQLQTGQATAISQPQAISGLGGIGKTQIAIEYAFEHACDYQAVLWILSDTRESLVSGYVAVAGLLDLSEKNEQDQAVVIQAVKDWLQTHREWLLILDNADELAVVREFTPSFFNGHILMTTRVQSMGLLAERIEVEIMGIEVGALFLLRRAGLVAKNASLDGASPPDVETACELVSELGGLPLALDQAGAYLQETQCTLLSYQQRYHTHRALLLRRRGGLALDHPEPVATTWSLSFNKVEQINPVAADLLRVCAFLAPDAIPEEILTQGAAHLGSHLSPVVTDPFMLDEAMAVLGNYSLIQRNGKDNTFSIHRLVQVVLKDMMKEPTKRQWAKRAVQAVNEVFPDGNPTTWQQCERCLSHVLACTMFIEQEGIKLLEATTLLRRVRKYQEERHRDWGNIPDVSVFFGRTKELTLLEQWIAEDRCRLVALTGMKGIGKTGLAVLLGKGGATKTDLSLKQAQGIHKEFDYIIWRSLLSAPPVSQLLTDLIKFLSNQQEVRIPDGVSEQILRLLHYLQKSRCLVILDNIDTLLQGGTQVGRYHPGYEEYGQLFERIAESPHQSCFLLISREKPPEVVERESAIGLVRSLEIRGLSVADGKKIFADLGSFWGSEEDWKQLNVRYDGNPLGLALVAHHIKAVFWGSISEFLEEGNPIFDDLRMLLDWHFDRLSDTQREVMYWFAINREPTALSELKEDILSSINKERISSTLSSLQRLNLLEKRANKFILPPVYIEYLTGRFIEQVVEEIKNGKIYLLNTHALLKASAPEYVRNIQYYRILKSISKKLFEMYGNRAKLEERLQEILALLQEKFRFTPGYAGGNVFNLLCSLEVNLRGYDFSNLSVWQADLRGVSVQEVNFDHADLAKSIFTDT